MRLSWQDLPKRQHLFTVRNAAMMNLDTKKIIQHYSANTRIDVIQKAQHGEITYYRTASAAEKGLNWAFEASAFGLPNERAPLAPTGFSKRSNNSTKDLATPSLEKQTNTQKAQPAKSGELVEKRSLKRRLKGMLLNIFK